MRGRHIWKRITCVTLVLALVFSGIPVSVRPAVVKAAATDSTMKETDILDERFIEDTKVLQYYTILGNAQKLVSDGEAGAADVLADLSGKTAGQILAEYTDTKYTRPVLGVYLTEYTGKIDFSGITVGKVEGIGWARSASEIDLSSADFTRVPNAEFASCKGLKKILLPSGVTEIGANAFQSCQSLTTLQIGDGGEEGVVDLTKVTTIGDTAFRDCKSMREVRFADYSEARELKIGSFAFAYCEKLQEVEIPIRTAANLGNNAFENCTGLTRVGLEDGLQYIGNAVFSGSGAESLYLTFYVIGDEDSGTSRLPESITYIGNDCFKGAFLAHLDLSKCTGLKTINQYAFATTRFWGSIIFPESLEKMEAMAFNNAIFLNPEISLPGSCTEFGTGVFNGSNIERISLPKGMKTITKEMFANCKNLDGNHIVIPGDSQLETIEEGAFRQCETLKTTAFLKSLKNLKIIGKEAFAQCYRYVLKPDQSIARNQYNENWVEDGLREVVLPDCVETLGESAFADNYALRTVDFGQGVKVLPARVLYNANGREDSGAGLEKVTVSSELAEIGESAFENQKRLCTLGYGKGNEAREEEGVVQFHDGLLSVGNRAFAGCGLVSSFSVRGVKAHVEEGDVKTEPGAGLCEYLVYDYQNGEEKNGFARTVYINPEKITRGENIADSNIDILAQKKYVDRSALRSEEDKQDGDTVVELYDTYDTTVSRYKNRFYGGTTSTVRYYVSKEELDTVVSALPVSGYDSVYAAVSTAGLPGYSADYTLRYLSGMRNVVLPGTLKDANLGDRCFGERRGDRMTNEATAIPESEPTGLNAWAKLRRRVDVSLEPSERIYGFAAVSRKARPKVRM